MTEQELEDAIRKLCDDSGLAIDEMVEVLDVIKAGYEMLAADED